MSDALIKVGDFVFINGGGSKRLAEVKKGTLIRMGRSGTADAATLADLRYGEVVRLDHKKRRFVPTNEYPDLDLTDISKEEEHNEENDNRNLVDNNSSQLLSNEEVAAIRKEKGLDELLQTLVEKSATFESKTSFSKEKYLRKKKKKYGILFKLEKPTIDNIAETHIPTINPSDDAPDDSRNMRLRVDTVALLLHYANVMYNSRVLLYEKTNGVLGGYLLSRLGEEGRMYQVMDRNAQPTTHTAQKLMQLPAIRERWKAIPRNPGFLEGVEEEVANAPESNPNVERPVSQWMKGIEGRNTLLDSPADSLVVVDDESTEKIVTELFPFLADGGHLVVYSPFLEDLTPLFQTLRNSCININLSETWYRHHQVLPQRTHPTVNMSTAAGYLLTGIKVPSNPAPRPRFTEGVKRPREEGDDEKAVEAPQL